MVPRQCKLYFNHLRNYLRTEYLNITLFDRKEKALFQLVKKGFITRTIIV
jgi:hypothetical protein